jgi:predicted amidohydrolase
VAFAVKESERASVNGQGPSQTVRASLVQAHSRLGTETVDPRDDNLGRAIEAIKAAAGDGARLVAFGELYLTGYRTDEWLHRWATSVYPPDDHVQTLVECARTTGVVILMGAATHGRRMPGDVYNSTLIVGPEGLIGVYRKAHVAGFPYSHGISLERCFYSPGKELPVYDTPAGRLGVHICYDLSFPEVSRVQTLRGAQMLVNTSASAEGFEEYWDHVTYTRAVENTTWYVVCSVVGTQRGDVLFGGSRVVDPSGAVVAKAKHNEEDVLTADIDLELPRRIRSTSHVLSVRQPELYAPIAEPLTGP